MTTSAAPRNILLVDDDPVSRKYMAHVLENSGYRVQEAINGVDALALARESRPDLIIADLLMPVMDGYELAHLLRQDEALGGTPVILYTATYTQHEARALAEECGVCEVLSKPIKPARLLSCVARALDSKPATVIPADFAEKHRRLLIAKLLDQSGELKQVKALQAEEAMGRLVAILEATPDFVGIINASDGKPVYVNPAGRRMLGISLNEEIEQLAPSDFRPQWATDITEREAIPEAIQNGAWVGETAFLSRDGREIPVSQVVLAHKSATGELEYVSTIARDIGRMRQLEEQLRKSQKMEAVGRLAGGIAHDFNNMLTVILGHLAILEDGPGLRDLAPSVAAIRHAAERVSQMTNQLLAFSRKQILQPQILNLNAIVTDMKEMLGRAIGEEIEIRTVFAEDIGKVRADAAQIEQSVMNLAINSRDAMPQGGVITIETSTADVDTDSCIGDGNVPPGRYAVLSIRDNGSGMNSQTLAHLFEPFFSTKPLGEAVGMGLATTYGIVQQAGGCITVYSEVGIGTTFRIYLPRIDFMKDNGAAKTKAGGTETILLIESDDGIRGLARELLNKYGYTVLEAASYAEALQVNRTYTNAIHLLITDLVLPQASGSDLASIFLRRGEMKVLYMSGYSRQFAIDHNLLQPEAAYLEKPFSFHALAQSVRETLDSGFTVKPAIDIERITEGTI